MEAESGTEDRVCREEREERRNSVAVETERSILELKF